MDFPKGVASINGFIKTWNAIFIATECLRASKVVRRKKCHYLLLFFFRHFCFFFHFGNQLPCPICFSRVSFTQLWRSNGFPFFRRCKHLTFALTKIAFSFGFSCPFRSIILSFPIQSRLVQSQILNI